MKKKSILVFLVVLTILLTACAKSNESKKEVKNDTKKEEVKEEKNNITGTFFAKTEDGVISHERYITFNSDNTVSLQVIGCGAVWTSTGKYTINNNVLEIKIDDDEEDIFKYDISDDLLIAKDDKSKTICGFCNEIFNSFIRGNEDEKVEVNSPDINPSPDDSMW